MPRSKAIPRPTAKPTETYDFVATGAGFALDGQIALTPAEPAPPPLTLTPATLPSGKVGQPYAAQLHATGGTSPYTYDLSHLPTGLAIDPATGAITGTPQIEGPVPTLGVTLDAAGETAEEAYVVAIAPADPVVPTSVFSLDQFTYKGCFRQTFDGVLWSELAYGQMTGRKINGQVQLLFTGNENYGAPVIAVDDPGEYALDYRTAPQGTFHYWGPEYRNRRGVYLPPPTRLLERRRIRRQLKTTRDPIVRAALERWIDTLGTKTDDDLYVFPNNLALNGGLRWLDDQQLLLLQYHDAYNVTGRPDQCLMLIRLNADGTTTGYGPWRPRVTDADGRSWGGAHRCMYYTAHPDTGKMVHGATLQSGSAASPWGPDLYGQLAWPTPDLPTGLNEPDLVSPDCWLEHYYIGPQINGPTGTYTGLLRAFRRRVDPMQYDYYEGDPAAGIPPDNPSSISVSQYGYGSWGDSDFVAGVQWLRHGSRAGVLFFGNVAGAPEQDPMNPASAHTWYMNAHKPVCPDHGMTPPLTVTGPVVTHAFPFMCCYDEQQLERVRRKEIPDYAPEPSWFVNLMAKWNVRTAPETMYGAARAIAGGYFDVESSQLYLMAPRADDSNWGTVGGALFHVWHIAA